MIPIFKTADGRIINGGQSFAILPGKSQERSQTVKKTSIPNRLYDNFANNRQVSYSQGNGKSKVALAGGDLTGESIENPNVKTATINVPREMGKRMAQLPPQSFTAVKPKQYSLEELNQIRFSKTQTEAKGGEVRKGSGDNAEPTTDIPKPPAQRPVFGKPGAFR